MLDVQLVINDLLELMHILGEMITTITSETVGYFTYAQIKDLCARENLLLEQDFESEHYHSIKKFLPKYYFIYDYPQGIKPFYIKTISGIDKGFDLMCEQLELASGGLRQQNYNSLFKKLEFLNLDTKNFIHYLEAFKWGMPPHGGFGLGIDRLLQKICNLSDIRYSVISIRDKHKIL